MSLTYTTPKFKIEIMEQPQMSLGELRQKYVAPRENDMNDTWFQRSFYGRLATHLATFLVNKTVVSGNQITVLWIVVGISGCWLLSIPAGLTTFLGCLFLYSHLLLDEVDGVIARARHQVSSSGVFLDRVGHDIIYPCSLFSLAVRGMEHFPPGVILIAGFIAAHGFFLYNNLRRAKIISYFLFQRQFRYKRMVQILREESFKSQPGKRPRLTQSKFFRTLFNRIRWVWKGECCLRIIYGAALLNKLEWVPIFYAVTTIPLLIIAIYHQSQCGDRWVEEYILERQTATAEADD